MATYRIKIFLVLMSVSNSIYSQSIDKPDDLSIDDFDLVNFKSPTILLYNIMVSFPYIGGGDATGAFDELFNIKIESYMRIALSRAYSTPGLLVIPSTFKNGIKINSLEYHYKKHYSISTRELKKSDVLITSDKLGYYLDFSKSLNDSISIIDINFSSTSNSKEFLSVYLNKNVIYKDFSTKINIPEIYTYEIEVKDSCIKSKTDGCFYGPIIGYQNGGNNYLWSKFAINRIKDNSRIIWPDDEDWTFFPVYCRLYSYTFRIKNTCPELTKNTFQEILTFKLDSITEIKYWK